MRQVIKGDGSDGTAALKAYLLAHDNVLAQELYEFIRPGSGLTPTPVPESSTVFDPAIAGTFIPDPDLGSFAYGAGAASGDTGYLKRWESRPWWAYSVPGTLQFTTFALYGAPGSDSAFARPRSDLVKVIAAIDYTLTPGQGGFAPLYTISVSVDGGAHYHGMASPVLSSGTNHLTLDITGYILALGPIASFDFTQIKFFVGLGSSIFVTVPAPGADLEISGAGLIYDYGTSDTTTPPTSSSLIANVCDASSALTYAGNVYQPAVIKNSGFKSKIGLDVDSLTLEWTFRGDEALVTDPDTGATILTMLQGFKQGLFEGVWLRWRRVYMPTFGDCDSLGAVSAFRGRIAPVEVDRLTAKITVNSITELFNRQIPQQLIEANNRSMQVGPGLPPDLDPNPEHWTYFDAVADHDGTVQKIVARQTDPVADQVYAPGTYDMGYLWFQASPLKYVIVQVHHYDVSEDGFNIFYLFRPLYVDPHAYGSRFAAFIPVPKDQDISGASGVELKGFKFVPVPEQAV